MDLIFCINNGVYRYTYNEDDNYAFNYFPIPPTLSCVHHFLNEMKNFPNTVHFHFTLCM